MKPTIVEPATEQTEEDEMSTTVSPTPITEHELEQVERANATMATPVVFIHGLWLLPSSWANWADFFNQAGYAPLTPGWPRRPGNG
jgi:hypothetical protein